MTVTSAALICLTGLTGLTISSQALAVAPTVSLTAPAANARYGAPIAITATAADSKGTISKVEFYNGTTLLGSATASPYSYSWTNAAIGTYSLTAKVTDSQSLTQTSSAVSVQVKAAATTPPTVSLTPALKQTTQTAPANGTFVAPAGISLAATATPASGSTISKVEFYQGATLIGTATAPTVTNGTSYSVNWSNVTANSYNITAKATDNKNAIATTAPVTVNVINNSAPTVSLTANPANATAPATIILNATATDSDGTITQVEFLNGTNSIATVTQAPYTTNWANVAQGSYSLTAKATDNLGASTTSAAVPVAVTANTPKAYDIHADHLNTPRVITDATGTEVWRWDSAPFGETLPNEQPANQPTKFVFNQRFPGQYFDQETGLHYNYFRDYDPLTGRYVESDPIGLRGGINTYGYVGGNPTKYSDQSGLVINSIIVNGNKVIIDLRINYNFKGMPPDPNLIKFWNDSIQSMWSGQFGKYNVKVNVSNGCKCTKNNNVDVTPEMPRDGRDWSHFNGVSDWGVPSTAGGIAHEAGHLMGIILDKYYYGGFPKPGWENNIMASPESGRIDERNIQEIIDFNKGFPNNPNNCDCCRNR